MASKLGITKVSNAMEPEEISAPVLLPHELLDAVACAGRQQAWRHLKIQKAETHNHGANGFCNVTPLLISMML